VVAAGLGLLEAGLAAAGLAALAVLITVMVATLLLAQALAAAAVAIEELQAAAVAPALSSFVISISKVKYGSFC
jgi:hypothetical protein